MKHVLFFCLFYFLILLSCVKDTKDEELVTDCFSGDFSNYGCIPDDSIYINGTINGKYWKAQSFKSSPETFKDYMFVDLQTTFPFDSCKSQAYLSLGSDVWGNFAFRNVNDTIFFRNAPGFYGFAHAWFSISYKDHYRSHRLIINDSLSKSNYITLSGVNRDTSIFEGRFALEFMNSNGSFKSEYIYLNGKFRLKKCR